MFSTSTAVSFSDIAVNTQFIPVAEYDVDFPEDNLAFTKVGDNTFSLGSNKPVKTKNLKMACYIYAV